MKETSTQSSAALDRQLHVSHDSGPGASATDVQFWGRGGADVVPGMSSTCVLPASKDIQITT